MYTKVEHAPLSLDVLVQALRQQGVAGELAQEMQDAGAFVQLDSGELVWLACVLHDNPTTPQVDFLTMAIALVNDMPRYKANGQLVCYAFWHGVMPDALPVLGINQVRKALSMIALGEPQPQRTIEVPGADGVTEHDLIDLPYTADRCIRTYIAAADEVAGPLQDVL